MAEPLGKSIGVLKSNKRMKLLDEVKKIKEQYEFADKIGVRAYVSQCPSNIMTQSDVNISRWIQGFNQIRRNSPKFENGDIREFFLPNQIT